VVQVLAQLAGAVGGVAGELFRRCGQTGGVMAEPAGEQLQVLGELGRVAGVQGHLGMGSPPSQAGRVGLVTVKCPGWWRRGTTRTVSPSITSRRLLSFHSRAGAGLQP
jgi:hypothetical protein